MSKTKRDRLEGKKETEDTNGSVENKKCRLNEEVPHQVFANNPSLSNVPANQQSFKSTSTILPFIVSVCPPADPQDAKDLFNYYNTDIFHITIPHAFNIFAKDGESLFPLFSARIPALIRVCYYRIIIEILLVACDKNLTFSNKEKGLVVTGNPGIGKSALSYLFIRVLLELGVEEITHRMKYCLVTLTMKQCKDNTSKELSVEITFYIKNEISYTSSFSSVWNPNKYFVTKNVRDLVGGLSKPLSKSWVVLDDCSFYNICPLLRMRSVMVLFSSPQLDRWVSFKQSGFYIFGFGMELWSDEEFNYYSTNIIKNHLCYLCENNSSLTTDFVSALSSVLVFDPPSSCLRREFFGMQPRFEFGDYIDLAIALNEIRKTLYKIITQGNLDSQAENTDIYNIIKLDFDPVRRKFMEDFISPRILSILVRFLEQREDRVFRNLLERSVSKPSLYGHLFEKYVDHVLVRGLKGKSKILSKQNLSDSSLNILKCSKKEFCFKRFGKTQVWFKNPINVGFEKLCNYKDLKESGVGLVLSQKAEGCATVDSIVVQSVDVNKFEVIFIQSTVRKSHNVSPAGFFAMLMFVNTVRFYFQCNVDVKFYFVVDEKQYEHFTSKEAVYLNSLFDIIDIRVVKLDKFDPTVPDDLKRSTGVSPQNPNSSSCVLKGSTSVSPQHPNCSNNVLEDLSIGIGMGFHFLKFNLNNKKRVEFTWNDIDLVLEELSVIAVPHSKFQKQNDDQKIEEVKDKETFPPIEINEKIKECIDVYENIYNFIHKRKVKKTEEDNDDNSDDEPEDNLVGNAKMPKQRVFKYHSIIRFYSPVFSEKDIYRTMGCWGLWAFISLDKCENDFFWVRLEYDDENVSSFLNEIQTFIDTSLIEIVSIEKDL